MVSEEFRRCENNWQRLYEELKQERDQAIVERNQAMVSLMEIEREQTTQTPEDLSRRQTTAPDVPPSIRRIRPKSEGRENPDWLGSLISRSNSILGEQMSEANAVYFPGSALQVKLLFAKFAFKQALDDQLFNRGPHSPRKRNTLNCNSEALRYFMNASKAGSL
jgi:hypothetical protein